MAILDNIVGAWMFDESSGNATDSSGNGNTLTNIGTATFTSGKINNAGTFNGTNQGFDRGNGASLTRTGAYSWNFWFKTNAWTYIFDHTSNSGGNNRIILYGDDATDCVHAYFNGNEVVSATNSITLGTWYMATLTKGSGGTGTCELFLNATSVGTTTFSTAGSSLNELSFGKSVDEGAWLNGQIDLAATWTRVLTGAEITSLYNGGAGLAYPFSGGGGGAILPQFKGFARL